MRRLALIASALTVALALMAAGVPANGDRGRVAEQKDTRAAASVAQQEALKRQIRALRRRVRALTRTVERLRPYSPRGVRRQLAQTKAATVRYQSADAARAAGYEEAGPCIASAEGGMGIHFENAELSADPEVDLRRPEMLLYEPTATGLNLVGVEYWRADADQNRDTDADRATLFGRAFDGPMAGHNPTMPTHYDLHVWVHRRNPSGMFAQYNPHVSC